MRKTSIAIAMALASIGTASVAWERTICALMPQSYPVSNRHTGKAAERRNAKRRRRAKK
ncbi:hypothetical protein [Klebsiella pneumoniae]|uniref:hypothetical protein n=1 Tax=Klebsiella pneumoniae TaxID=573 RepID=UPI00247FF9BC|nr:hypothetical protein [Klebsiella pneumoniae]MDI0385963.1 hypothetical protein [Klebsiella pneumoniae]MDI0437736.1 hypothetical protein [Klebsiella pneumoniae]